MDVNGREVEDGKKNRTGGEKTGDLKEKHGLGWGRGDRDCGVG
jgi:hypothetical protein